jgi:uncharacterized protein involved in exopolysaccharide biosynthesis
VLTQQAEVLESEKFLAETRSEYQFIAGRGAALTATELEQLNRELIQTRATQAKIEAKLALVDHLKANGGRLDTLPEAIASPVITRRLLPPARKWQKSQLGSGKRSTA